MVLVSLQNGSIPRFNRIICCRMTSLTALVAEGRYAFIRK